MLHATTGAFEAAVPLAELQGELSAVSSVRIRSGMRYVHAEISRKTAQNCLPREREPVAEYTIPRFARSRTM